MGRAGFMEQALLLGKERDACEPTEFPDIDEHLQAEHPHLIMQPQTKKMPTPPWKEAAEDAAASSWEKKSWKKDDSWKGYEKKDWKKKDQWSLPVKKTAPPQHIVDRHRYWSSNAWEADFLPSIRAKKSKGQKRKIWLKAQMETLKAEGRWLGDQPDKAMKQRRLMQDPARICFDFFD